MARQSSRPIQTPNHAPVCTQNGSPTSSFDRTQELAALLPFWESELRDTSDAGRLRVLAKLRRALRIERLHGTSGHWSYNLARHKALLEAYRREAKLVREEPTLRRVMGNAKIQDREKSATTQDE